MAFLTSDNTPLPVALEAMYPTGTTGAIPSGNSATGFSISLGSLELSGSTSLFNAQIATIVIINTGTSQTINAATLTFSDTVGAQTPSISYTLSGVSIASGASMPFLVSLNSGILKNALIIVTFAAAPTAGSATIQATFQSGNISSTGGGTTSSVALNDNTTPSQHATIDGSGNLHVTDAKVPATGQATMVNSLPVVIASNQTAIPISGSITASNASIGTDGSAIPTSSTLIGASDGTNLQQLLVESASNRNLRTALYSGANEATVTGANALKTDGSAVTQPVSASSLPLPTGASTAAKQPALGTAGTASSDVLSVQGIASMTPLKIDGSAVTQPVSGTVTANVGTTNGIALDTSVNGVIVAQGSTTSVQKGPLIQGAVTTSAPSYTTAQTSPISLTTAGAMRVDASATTQPISGTVSVNALPAGSALIGSVELVDSAGTNKATISAGGAVKVDGSAATQPVSATTLPLPSGASTAAKQPALGTAGTASSDVLTVQGIASMTALKVDGSAVTQPVSGTVGVSSLPALSAGSALIGAVNLDLGGSALSNTNPVPSQDIEQASYASASSPPSATNAGSDTAYTFSSQVSRIIIQNNTSANVNYAFDTTSSAGSLLLVPGSMLVYPKKCTVLHLFTTAAQNINGTTAGNIVVLGAL